MDSIERDKRAEEGFSERGDILYDAGKDDERKNLRKKRSMKRRNKDGLEYSASTGKPLNIIPRKLTQSEINALANEYGLDDEEWEDLEGSSNAEDDSNNEEKENP